MAIMTIPSKCQRSALQTSQNKKVTERNIDHDIFGIGNKELSTRSYIRMNVSPDQTIVLGKPPCKKSAVLLTLFKKPLTPPPPLV